MRQLTTEQAELIVEGLTVLEDKYARKTGAEASRVRVITKDLRDELRIANHVIIE